MCMQHILKSGYLYVYIILLTVFSINILYVHVKWNTHDKHKVAASILNIFQ